MAGSFRRPGRTDRQPLAPYLPALFSPRQILHVGGSSVRRHPLPVVRVKHLVGFVPSLREYGEGRCMTPVGDLQLRLGLAMSSEP